MNRKSFLKSIGIGSAALTVNPSTLLSRGVEKRTSNKIEIKIKYEGGAHYSFSNVYTGWFSLLYWGRELTDWNRYRGRKTSVRGLFLSELDRDIEIVKCKLSSSKEPWTDLRKILNSPDANIFRNLEICEGNETIYFKVQEVKVSINGESKDISCFDDYYAIFQSPSEDSNSLYKEYKNFLKTKS